MALAKLAEGCLARADQYQEPARGHPCRDNPRLDKEAPLRNQVALHPDKVCRGRKAHHEIQPEHKGPARPGNRRGWALALHQGQAHQGRHPGREAIDFLLS